MTRLEAARDYFARGWSPVPVRATTKKAFEPGWQNKRATEDDLAHRFSGDGNIGLLTGRLSSGLTDVDLDCDEAIALADALLPPTAMISGHRTRPRSHRWYALTGSIPPYCIFTDIGENPETLIEFRTDGHQTLVTPSIHPDGDAYEWLGPLEPAPYDGIALARIVRRLAAATLLCRHWPKVDGARHHIANALAGTLARAGWLDGDIAHLVSAVARTAGDEEARSRAQAALATYRKAAAGGRTTGAPTLATLLGDAVVAKVIDWLGLRAEQSNSSAGRKWEPPVGFHTIALPEFPVASLPDWMATLVNEIAVATQTPPSLAGGLVLAVVGMTAARRVRIEIRPGWTEPTNLFTATALASGSRKSAVFALVAAPVTKYEGEEARRIAPELRAAESKRRILLKALKKAEDQAAKAALDGDFEDNPAINAIQVELAALVVPVVPRLFADDVTPESLSQLVARHAGRFAVLSPEGGVFELMAGRYSGKDGAGNFEIYLKGHAGDPLRVDRVTREGEVVNFPAVTLGLAFQPEVLRGLAAKPGLRGRGLLARILYSYPTSLVGRRKIGPSPVSEATLRRYERRLLTYLRTIPEAPDPASPPLFRLSAEAHERLTEFERRLEPTLGAEAELGTIADWAGKLVGAIARIAASLHLARFDDVRHAINTTVNLETIENGIELGRFYLAHARAAFAEMGADPEVERAKIILAWVRRNEKTGFSQREVFQGVKGQIPKVAELRTAIELLVDHGHLRPVLDEAPRPGPGRPRSERYEVNPLWNRNSEDIENIGDDIQTSTLNEVSSPEAALSPPPTSKLNPESHPQYPHNPQNSGPGSDDPVDEVVL